MSYVANQYNHATPLSSAAGLVSDASVVQDANYFVLNDNTLDGSYVPVTGDVGLWGSTAADAQGILSTPFVVTVTESMAVNAIRIQGSVDNYPVAFTVALYNGTTLLYTITETSNDKPTYVGSVPSLLQVTSYVISISKISKPGAAARLYNTYNAGAVVRTDSVTLVAALETSIKGTSVYLRSTDTALIRLSNEPTHVFNKAKVSTTALLNSIDVSTPTNIHTVMKSPSREVYGKVLITYTDPMLDSDTAISSNSTAYNSNEEQLFDNIREMDSNLFTLYENDLSGNYVLSDANTQVGWTSGVTSNALGNFETPVTLGISFSARPVLYLPIVFSDAHNCLPKNFTVTLATSTGDIIKTFVDNTSTTVVVIDEVVPNVSSVTVTITSATRANYPVTILDIPIKSSVEYAGYKDFSQIMSIDLLEELTYEDAVEALGGMSANEVTVTLDNSDKHFNFDNTLSPTYNQLRRNRRIEPYLGTEVIPGTIEWYKLGVFWSYKWDIPVGSLTATVVGFDTIGLLDLTLFTHQYVQQGKSLGYLIEYVLNDAKELFSFIEYDIDTSLYNVIIPYAWFDYASHAAALRKISSCYPMHIYCDRNGRIVAAPQKLHLDYHYDTWSDSDTIIGKTYSSLYTALPNIINVTAYTPMVLQNETLVNSTVVLDSPTNQTLLFSKPYLYGLSVDVDADATITYIYQAYSWGIVFSFAGSGTVRSITCTGHCVDISNASTVNYTDDYSVHLNGAMTRDIQSDFIQSTAHANLLIERINTLSENDKYDVDVDYRGDISLSINDPIELLNGIAPINKYNIRRHELSWNGALHGSANLNT